MEFDKNEKRYWVFYPQKKQGKHFPIKGGNVKIAIKKDKDPRLEWIEVFDGKETYKMLGWNSDEVSVCIDFMKMISIY